MTHTACEARTLIFAESVAWPQMRSNMLRLASTFIAHGISCDQHPSYWAIFPRHGFVSGEADRMLQRIRSLYIALRCTVVWVRLTMYSMC